MLGAAPAVLSLTRYADAREALRHKDLREATHDDALFLLDNTLLVLHGDAHTRRRRVENRAFRRDALAHVERELIDPILDDVLPPFVARGRGDLVEISHRLVMNLAALAAGIDRPERTPAETDRLYQHLQRFSQGATIKDTTRGRDDVQREVQEALELFTEEFFAPSAARRRALIERHARGELAEDALPHDVLTVLLRHREQLAVPDDLLPREVALFLVGAHTAANQVTHLVHEAFAWVARHPEDAARLHGDLRWLQRALQESLRLNPPAPALMRATPSTPVTLRTGTVLPGDTTVVVDLDAANRDTAVFGPDATVFNPGRAVPADVSPWGLSFGAGTHACIGQEMAAGLPLGPGGADTADYLYGAVPRLVRGLLDRRMAPDPHEAPRRAGHTTRREWGTYPVVFPRAHPPLAASRAKETSQ